MVVRNLNWIYCGLIISLFFIGGQINYTDALAAGSFDELNAELVKPELHRLYPSLDFTVNVEVEKNDLEYFQVFLQNQPITERLPFDSLPVQNIGVSEPDDFKDFFDTEVLRRTEKTQKLPAEVKVKLIDKQGKSYFSQPVEIYFGITWSDRYVTWYDPEFKQMQAELRPALDSLYENWEEEDLRDIVTVLRGFELDSLHLYPYKDMGGALIKTLAALGDKEEALEYFQHYQQRVKKFPGGEKYSKVFPFVEGLFAMQMGELEKALRYFDGLSAPIEGLDRWAKIYQAVIYNYLGEKQLASDLVQKACQMEKLPMRDKNPELRDTVLELIKNQETVEVTARLQKKARINEVDLSEYYKPVVNSQITFILGWFLERQDALENRWAVKNNLVRMIAVYLQ